MSAEEISNRIGNEIWQQYFKFCVIRNPYEKVLSAFFHFVVFQNQITEGRPLLIAIFREWVRTVPEEFYDRDKYFLDGKICIDFFIRFENLNNDLSEACQHLNIPYEPDSLSRLKSHIRPANAHVGDFYNFAATDIVNHLFEFEFDYFGYEKML